VAATCALALTAFPDSSRRDAAASTQANGETAAGEDGELPENASTSFFTRFASGVETLAVDVSATSVVTSVVVVPCESCEVETADSVEVVVAVWGAWTLTNDSGVFFAGVAATSMVALVPLAAAEDVGAVVGVDHNRCLPGFGAASASVASFEL